MRVTIAVLALIVFAQAINHASQNALEKEFAAWQSKHGKTYATAQEQRHRLGVYMSNAKFVAQHDAAARGFSVALNEFADLTNAEFVARMNGMNITKQPMLSGVRAEASLPDSVDWRTQGAVTPVKNQGQCGSCWSFSATGSMEGAHKLAGNSLVSLSEQNLVDCSTAQGNMGCNGGLMDQAFQYVISNRGIDTEASYPYTATGPNQCQYNSQTIGARISGFQDIPSGSETALQNAVAQRPVSVAIDASHSSFQFYSSGVYNEPACSSSQLDHGVLAIGYGSENGTPYWLVKNSWGTSWGLNGYIKMSRNLNNQCGIATAASYPTV